VGGGKKEIKKNLSTVCILKAGLIALSNLNFGRLGDLKCFGVGLRNGDCRMKRLRGN
jgi:hypothetical protein